MNRIYKVLSSSSLALFLLLVFAVSMAAATFIENDFGTATAWKLIYNAAWFELVMVLLAISFLMNIIKYRLIQRKQWAILTFHISFIVIIIGAGITRYVSDSGLMRIREGASSNIIISDERYIVATFSNSSESKTVMKKIDFSPFSDNYFELPTEFNGQNFSVIYKEYIPDAVPEIIDNTPDGEPMLQMVVSVGQGRETVFLKKGEIQALGEHRHLVGFHAEGEGVINITEDNGNYFIKSPRPVEFFRMADQSAGSFAVDTIQPFALRTVVRDHDVSFVVMSYHPQASFGLVSGAEKPMDNDELKDDALLVEVKAGEELHDMQLLYRQGFVAMKHDLHLDDVTVQVSYGSIAKEIPFSLHLNDFILERYPGSSSPSAYESELVVVDGEEEIPYKIFMNNVLDYGGYRFFQASYDTDERGTLLAVNQDVLGTSISYFGYLLMGLGMFFALFGKKSRFHTLNKSLKKMKKSTAMLILALSSVIATAQHNHDSISSAGNAAQQIGAPEELTPQYINKQHSELFGELLVQDVDGRIKPINTLASEFLRKITRKPYFQYESHGEVHRITDNQWFLSIHVNPNRWANIPLIKIDQKKGGELFKGLNPNKFDLVSFQSLINDDGSYKFAQEVEEANQKKPAERNEFDKELLKVDERFNIVYGIFTGGYLKVFPKKDDENNTWFSLTHHFNDFPPDDAEFCRNIFPYYFQDILAEDYEKATEKLSFINTFQQVLGAEIVPSAQRVTAEIYYNKLNLNFWLFQVYFTFGFILLVLALAKIFSSKKIIEHLWNINVIIVFISFLIFTANILLRWYVADHAPWSNGYEMMVFVSWVLLLCGFIAHRQSDFVLPLATLFTGALLFVSYLDWINPEITNLMPVLKSYWLKVHVATIVSSYAPLALSAVLGLMALVLMVIKRPHTKKKIDVKIKELSFINEISMTIGLFVLSVGTFLGGIWANESWGRYWAWDPKETWALISIIIYAIVLHLRFVPKLNNRYVLNMASMFAFWSIIMTSFGVNYYLSGLHSYAAGDPLPIPKFVYFLAAFMIVLAILGYRGYKRFSK